MRYFHRDGRLVGLGKEHGAIEPLRVEKRQHHEVDTNKFGVCVWQMHQDVDAVLLRMKDLRMVDNEEVLLVSVDVWFLVGELSVSM